MNVLESCHQLFFLNSIISGKSHQNCADWAPLHLQNLPGRQSGADCIMSRCLCKIGKFANSLIKDISVCFQMDQREKLPRFHVHKAQQMFISYFPPDLHGGCLHGCKRKLWKVTKKKAQASRRGKRRLYVTKLDIKLRETETYLTKMGPEYGKEDRSEERKWEMKHTRVTDKERVKVENKS